MECSGAANSSSARPLRSVDRGRTTPGTFCNVVDLVLDIVESLFPTLFTSNIANDLLFARFDCTSVTSDSLFSVLRELGVEWSTEKTQSWSCRFKFGGVWVDLDEMTVELDGEKKLKYALKLEQFLEGRARDRKRLDDVLSIVRRLPTSLALSGCLPLVCPSVPYRHLPHLYLSPYSQMGTLLYVCEIIPAHRSYLNAFLGWRRKFPDSTMSARHLTRTVLDELDDWLRFLHDPEPLKASFALLPSVSSHYFFTDACSRGLRVVVDGNYTVGFTLSQQWAEYATKPGHISAPEAWAVKVVGAIVEALGLADVAILVGVDNTNVVNTYAKGRAANKLVNNMIRHLAEQMQQCNVILFLRYVNTKLNPGDAVSPGFIDPRLSPFPIQLPLPPGTEAGPWP
ncbi:hypothetical protein JCM1840_002144 [Sporobolomyces johnsonii]